MVGEHWINERHLRVTSLDPSRPAYVMYYPLPGREHEQVLVGTAYGMVQPWGADAPDGFAGTHDVWHVHVLCTALDHLGSTFTASAAECLELGGEPAKHQLAMLHVWFEPKNPEGPFAPDNVALPFVAAGLAPPAPGDLRDPADAQRMRKLALALSETYGATPRGGGFIEQRPTKIFARFAAGFQNCAKHNSRTTPPPSPRPRTKRSAPGSEFGRRTSRRRRPTSCGRCSRPGSPRPSSPTRT
jgi:hypothetical protein